MRKIFAIVLLCCLIPVITFAQSKVTDETGIDAVASGDEFYCNDVSGPNADRKCTAAQIQTFVNTGNAATASALASNGANCSAGNYPLGVDASGAVEGCTAVGGGSHPVTDDTILIQDNVDNTKQLRFILDNVGSGVTRTITMRNGNVDLGNLGAAELGSNIIGISELDENTVSGIAHRDCVEIHSDIVQFTFNPACNYHYERVRLYDSGANASTGTTLAGDVRLPFPATILDVGGYVDTAGTTGTMVVDVHLNGTTIMTTDKIDIETGEKTSESAATQPALTTTAYSADDVLTFDVDTAHTTPAVGLTVWVKLQRLE